MTTTDPHPEELAVEPLVDGPMTWAVLIISWAPLRLQTTVACRHGNNAPGELTALNGAVAPPNAALASNAAANLRRKYGCTCYLSPAP
jgi:hypothetical protein